MGSIGDSHDIALAESVIGLFKTEVIRLRGPWRSLEEVEFEEHYRGTSRLTPWWRGSTEKVSGIHGAVQVRGAESADNEH